MISKYLIYREYSRNVIIINFGPDNFNAKAYRRVLQGHYGILQNIFKESMYGRYIEGQFHKIEL